MMKSLGAAAFLMLLAAPAMAQSAPPAQCALGLKPDIRRLTCRLAILDQERMALVDEMTAAKAELEMTRAMLAKTADDQRTAESKLHQVQAYWRMWCGTRPGCARFARPHARVRRDAR